MTVPTRERSTWAEASLLLIVLFGTTAAISARADPHEAPTPAFSRMYGTACSTCHTAAPKLNVLGEAFRLNGYRMPDNQTLARRDQPVSLGAPEWDEAWPRVIRSSDLPGLPPVAIRIVSDAEITRDERVPYDATYRFPQEVHLLAGTPLGDDVSVWAEGVWDREHGLGLHQARIELHDVVPVLPARSLDLSVGMQHLYLLTLMDEHIDLAGRQRLAWQTFEPSEVEVGRTGDAPALSSPNSLSLHGPQAAVEVNGLVGGRLSYGLGVSQGLQDGGTDANARKDLYYKLRYKVGGLDLAGRYDPGDEPDLDMPGQLLDHALVLEHFGYFGSEATDDAPQGGHRAFGMGLRALLGRADLGAGWVVRDLDRPWPGLASGSLRATSAFARGEYLALPWVLASLKVERFDVSATDLPPGTSALPAPSEATRIVPGLVLLLRQNIRFVLEGELFTDAPGPDRAGLARPHGLWMRLDVAF